MSSRLPQAFDKTTTLRFHLSFLLCLLPLVASAAWMHGPAVLVTAALSTLTAWGCDVLLGRWRGWAAAPDGSAPLWGLMLALLLPANAPFYLPVLGAAFAVVMIKGVFGGGGTPWINPVLASWALLQAGWPAAFSALAPLGGDLRTPFDTQGTDWLNTNLFSWVSIQLPPGYLDLVVGLARPETSAIVESGPLLLLAVTIYLLAKGYFPWQIPAFYFLGFGLPMALLSGNVLFHLFSGGLLLNLFFLASDPSTRPLSRGGVIVFAAGAGLFTFLARTWGLAGDGSGYAVLLMNLFVPLLDQRFRRKSLNDFRLA